MKHFHYKKDSAPSSDLIKLSYVGILRQNSEGVHGKGKACPMDSPESIRQNRKLKQFGRPKTIGSVSLMEQSC